jgi:Arc/MetJ-type ribon-helix-helix transcriptional regulator
MIARQAVVVSLNMMIFASPELLLDYIDHRVHSGEYGNTSEYRRDLDMYVLGRRSS